MNAINTNTDNVDNALAAAQSTVSAQIGSIVILSFVIAIMRTILLVAAAVSLGATARFFFPEMFAIPNNPVTLLAVVAIDTFAIVASVLLTRANSAFSSKGH